MSTKWPGLLSEFPCTILILAWTRVTLLWFVVKYTLLFSFHSNFYVLSFTCLVFACNFMVSAFNSAAMWISFSGFKVQILILFLDSVGWAWVCTLHTSMFPFRGLRDPKVGTPYRDVFSSACESMSNSLNPFSVK